MSICYLVVGSSLATIKPSIARSFQLLGYGFFALILLGLLARQVSFLRKSHELIPSSRTVATGALVAAPFLLIRNVYGLLYYGTNYYTLDSNGQYTAHQSLWNPITGNHVAFALMGLLSEYISICVYFYVGFVIPSKWGVPELPNSPGTKGECFSFRILNVFTYAGGATLGIL